jgi:hypothetical protein
VTDQNAEAPHPEGAEILSEIRELFRAAFAWGTWGRLLVSVAPNASGELVVADILVEEVLEDEAALDAAFTSDDARASLPAIASAVVALCTLAGIPRESIDGGTFVQTHGGDVAFLPGLVRAPSPSIDARRDDLLGRLAAKNAVLKEAYGIGAGADVAADMATGSVEISKNGVAVAVGEQIVIGSFASVERWWVWGAFNPSLEEAARRRSAALLDNLRDRAPWEISTQGFVTDEATAWLLAALLAVEHDLEGVVHVPAKKAGFVLLGLRALSPAALA